MASAPPTPKQGKELRRCVRLDITVVSNGYQLDLMDYNSEESLAVGVALDPADAGQWLSDALSELGFEPSNG